jgi:hypothetical protein
MPAHTEGRRLSPWLALGTLLLCACADGAGPVAPPERGAPAPTPLLLASIACRAQVATAAVSCGDAHTPGALRGYIIVGGQGSLVQLASSGVAYNGGTGAFTFNLTVKNLIPQPLATLDGTTPHAGGVKVIFTNGPVVTAGTGNVSVTGDGTGDFDHSGEPYSSMRAGRWATASSRKVRPRPREAGRSASIPRSSASPSNSTWWPRCRTPTATSTSRRCPPTWWPAGRAA